MWIDTLFRQSHRVPGLSPPPPPPPKCTYRSPPCKGPCACQPCAGKEPREAAHESLEDVDTTGGLPHTIGRRRPARQISHIILSVEATSICRFGTHKRTRHLCHGKGVSAMAKGSAHPSFLFARPILRRKVSCTVGGLVLNAEDPV